MGSLGKILQIILFRSVSNEGNTSIDADIAFIVQSTSIKSQQIII
jgi:hypothetical protein